MRKLRRILGALLLILWLAAGAALVTYLVRGGELREVPEAVTRQYETAQDSLEEGQAWLREQQDKLPNFEGWRGNDSAETGPEAPKTEDAGSDRWEEFRQQVTEWMRGNSLVPAGEPAANGASAEPIEVFFAPVDPQLPDGIDDRFTAFIAGAEESICCALYELDFEAAADALIAAHESGVEVRLVSDSDYADEEGIQQCLDAGIPVEFDERSAFMHNKFCVVDGEHVWTGSTNLTRNGMFRNNNNALLIDSDRLAENYVTEFDELFYGEFGIRSPANTPLPEIRLGEVRIENWFAPEDGVRAEIIAEVREAEQAIDFMLFSFTSDEIAEAMAEQIRRGVRVRGVFEARNAGSQYSRDDYLREQGAQVYMDTNPYSMHHKVMIVDGRTVVTGSYNFSNAAEERNDENVLIIHSPEIAAEFTQEFERLIAN